MPHKVTEVEKDIEPQLKAISTLEELATTEEKLGAVMFF